MGIIYRLGILFYGLGIRLAALFNKKARKWIHGRRGLSEHLQKFADRINRESQGVIWFHVSSLGEFEQGRPLIEAIRKKWPEKKILLTFFSPSGYEIRKNYDQADYVCYIPADTRANARRFIKTIHPELIIFVKYDFWFNFLTEINAAKIPLIYISVTFRADQYFFKWYGKWAVERLKPVHHFFVQDNQSGALLKSVGIPQTTVAGDTRFDRVYSIAMQATPNRLVEKFCGTSPVFIAGSCWEPDEAVFIPVLEKFAGKMKFIIAPHDARPERIDSVINRIKMPVLTYGKLTEENAHTADILIIDCVGILNQLYRYATVAFIGGGFGSGLHNIQEPVTFGVPVIFGPVYHKFREAVDLVASGGAFTVTETPGLTEIILQLLSDKEYYKKASLTCKNYVEKNRGATDIIIQFLANHELIQHSARLNRISYF